MLLISDYLEVALFVALICFVVAKSFDATTSDGPVYRLTKSWVGAVAIAALIWPVLLVGLGQFLLLIGVSSLFGKVTNGLYRGKSFNA
jgi:hypothetical protein